MSWSLTIAGQAKELLEGTLRINYKANDRTTASFDVLSTSGLYTPALDAEVLIARDGVRLFGGLIDKPTKRGMFAGAKPGIVTRVTAVDFAAYPERRIIVDGGFPAGTTLLSALTSLETWLTPYGVTLDPSQVTGPTLPEILYPLTTVREALDGLVALTAASGEPYVWEIDEYKVLRMFRPSIMPAPFQILTNTPGYVVGDITVEPSNAGKANRVYVVASPKQEDGRIESFSGDGTTDTFTLQYTPTAFRGYVTSDGVFETLNRTGDADAATWTYDATTNSITRNSGAPASGTNNITIGFDGTYSGRAMQQHASVFTDPWERARTVEDVDNDATLQEMADAFLAESLKIPSTIKYRTSEQGLRVGQSQVITVPARGVNEICIITDIALFDQVNRLWWDVTALAGAQTNINRGWSNTVKNWSADTTTGSSITVGTGGPPSTGPNGPNYSAQINREGRFYGSVAFTFNPLTNCLVAGGGGTSITAADADSCQAFGYDCHISD